MENIFENAKLGDRFKTREGKMAIYYDYIESDFQPYKCVLLGCFGSKSYSEDGCYLGAQTRFDIVSRWEEPIDDKELETKAAIYADLCYKRQYEMEIAEEAYKAGFYAAKK